MRKVTYEELEEMAQAAHDKIWAAARRYQREPKIYLHWTAGHYNQPSSAYHVNITGDGSLYVSTEDLSAVLSHTLSRNSGSVGITLCGCFDASSMNLGSEPPTKAQIEAMAKATAIVADALWLTIDLPHVMTHGEAADNVDGLYTHDPYGPKNGCERWDLQYLGTDESPRFLKDYSNPATGGNVLRGKANFYRNQRKG